MTYRLHRSIPFWSGLFCILFLFFAWTDSRTHRSAASIPRAGIVSGAGRIALGVNLGSSWPYSAQRDIFVADPRDQLLERTGYQEIRNTGLDINLLTLNYLMLIAFSAAAWLGLLLWRIRRHRRLAAPRQMPAAP